MRILIYICTLLLLVSCRKDKLEGDKEILEGKWKWVYSYKVNLSPYIILDTIYNINGSTNYSMDFMKKGKVEFNNNGVVTKKRVVFKEFTNVSDDNYKVDIYLNNKNEDLFEGYLISNDTFTTRCYFPSDIQCGEELGGIHYYNNYFVRDN